MRRTGTMTLGPWTTAARARDHGPAIEASDTRASGSWASPGARCRRSPSCRGRRRSRTGLRRLRRLSRPAQGERRRGPRRAGGSGVTVKIVTGDNELVTQHVCAQLGLPVTACSPAKRSSRWTTRRCWRGWRASTCSAGSRRPRRTGSSWPQARAATWSAIWATASTMRRRCTRPTSASRWTPPSTSPRRPPT